MAGAVDFLAREHYWFIKVKGKVSYGQEPPNGESKMYLKV